MNNIGKSDKELRLEVWDQARILAWGTKEEQTEALKAISHLIFVLQHTKELAHVS